MTVLENNISDAKNIPYEHRMKQPSSDVEISTSWCGVSLANLPFHLLVIRHGQGFLLPATLGLLGNLVLSRLRKKRGAAATTA